jgi:hypothetical protein
MAPSLEPAMYRLPYDVRDCLTAATAAFRNAEAAVALATFLARFWSTPRRLGQSFPIDRRALANRVDLGLTEGRIRGAIRVLEAIGFLTRKAAPGSSYRPTAGGLRRKAILYLFGTDYLSGFRKANRRATAKLSNSPKSKSSEAARVLMGQQVRRPVEANPRLDAALDRFRDAVLTDKRIQLAIRGGPAQPNRTEKISHSSRVSCEPVTLRKLGG